MSLKASDRTRSDSLLDHMWRWGQDPQSSSVQCQVELQVVDFAAVGFFEDELVDLLCSRSVHSETE